MKKEELIEKIEAGEEVTLEGEAYDFEVIQALFRYWRQTEAMALATPEQQHSLLLENVDISCFSMVAKQIKPEVWRSSEDAYRILYKAATSTVEFYCLSKYIDTFKDYIKYVNYKQIGDMALDKLIQDHKQWHNYWILKLILAAPMGES